MKFEVTICEIEKKNVQIKIFMFFFLHGTKKKKIFLCIIGDILRWSCRYMVIFQSIDTSMKFYSNFFSYVISKMKLCNLIKFSLTSQCFSKQRNRFLLVYYTVNEIHIPNLDVVYFKPYMTYIDIHPKYSETLVYIILYINICVCVCVCITANVITEDTSSLK